MVLISNELKKTTVTMITFKSSVTRIGQVSSVYFKIQIKKEMKYRKEIMEQMLYDW